MEDGVNLAEIWLKQRENEMEDDNCSKDCVYCNSDDDDVLNYNELMESFHEIASRLKSISRIMDQIKDALGLWKEAGILKSEDAAYLTGMLDAVRREAKP